MKAPCAVTADRDRGADGVSRRRILAVCPDEGTARECRELCEFGSAVVKAPLMGSSRPVMRGGD